MEKRIGSILILVRERSATQALNSTISKYSHIILGRQGLPMQSEKYGLISLVLEGDTDEIGALTGQLGRISGISLKSVLLRVQESD